MTKKAHTDLNCLNIKRYTSISPLPDGEKKEVHFIGSRELNIKRVTRDRSCSVVMNMTCFNKLIEIVRAEI